MKSTRPAVTLPPELAEALAPLARLLAPIVAAQLGAAGAHRSGDFDQDDRPRWARSKCVYLRAWRVLADEQHPGCRALGRRRVMSADAAETWARRIELERPRRRRVVEPPVEAAPVVDAEAALLAELGARRSA